MIAAARSCSTRHARRAARRTRTCCVLGLLAAGVAAALALPDRALGATEAARTRISQVRVGFGGHYKVGYWTPVDVTLVGGTQSWTGHVELILPDGDGALSRVISERPVQTLTGKPTTVRLYAKFGQSSGDLDVRFVAEGKVRARRRLTTGIQEDEWHIPDPLDATDELFVCLGPSVGVAAAVQVKKRRADEPTVQVAELRDDLAQLPTRWYGWEGVDELIISSSDPELFDKMRPDSAQAAAIEKWVRLGGRLVMFVGREAPRLLGKPSVLASLAPGKYQRMVPLRRPTPLEAYCDTMTPIDTAEQRFEADVPLLVDVQGNIEAHEGNQPRDLPLVIRAAVGFGEVVFVAVDLDRPPLASWSGRPDVLKKLLRRRPGRAAAGNENVQRGFDTRGYDDLSGHLRWGLDNFKDVRPVPFEIVGLLVLVYILLIGPIDYWLVKKVLGRMEATWITFPFWVIVISVGAYFSAYWLKGRQLRTNQVELVDVDMESGLVRGATWTNIFSPQPKSYDLALEAHLPEQASIAERPRVLMSWLGLPGEGLGGMSAPAANPPLFRRPYDFAPQLDRMQQVPIQVWSTKAITTRWHGKADLPLEAELTLESDQTLRGTLRNRLGFDLEEAFLFYDRWVYKLGSLKEGEERTIDEDLTRLTSKTYFMSADGGQGRRSASFRRREATSVPRVMELMMFHEMAGGRPHTGLYHRYQSFCDLSQHLETGRAVLVGRVRGRSSELVGEDMPPPEKSDGRWNFYRFVLPVDRGEGGG